jgi:hypothetical protein
MDNLYHTRFVNEHFPPANKQVAIGETKHRCNKEGKAVFLTKTKFGNYARKFVSGPKFQVSWHKKIEGNAILSSHK